MEIVSRRWLYAMWVVLIGAFAVLHALNLAADFPNHTPLHVDWAKYTDEGWYANAAIRAHLFGRWYFPGDFNPAPAVPLWPFLEWILFFFTGVSIEPARALAVAFFFANLVLTYTLLRPSRSKWMALLALTLIVTSSFLYCFSRLAILEPMLTTLLLGVLNLAVRLPRTKRAELTSAIIGVLFTLMMLTKTTAIFLLPAIGWALFAAFWNTADEGASSASDRGRSRLRAWFHPCAIRCALVASATFVLTFGAWMALVVALGYFADYKYLLFINKYIKPTEFYWPLLSFWWSMHGMIWIDQILTPLCAILISATLAVAVVLRKQNGWGKRLLLDPVFGASIMAAGGYILFMTYQNHPQPRYYALVSVFCFVIIAKATEAMIAVTGKMRLLGWGSLSVAVMAIVVNGLQTVNYAAHPEYTFVNAARQVTAYMDQHPNGNRILVSVSADEISLVSHVETLCDDFGTLSPAFPDLPTKLAVYKPGWWATWNDIDLGTLEDIHTHYSLEQVASFKAFDDPERNELVLFKLHPLPGGQVRLIDGNNLQQTLPGDTINIPLD